VLPSHQRMDGIRTILTRGDDGTLGIVCAPTGDLGLLVTEVHAGITSCKVGDKIIGATYFRTDSQMNLEDTIRFARKSGELRYSYNGIRRMLKILGDKRLSEVIVIIEQ
jgi:hypothetical protein